jgi:hypothetical protein
MRLMYVTLRPAGHRPAQQYDSRMRAGGLARPGPTIVAESRWQVSMLFGFLTLVFTVALARGVISAQTASGRVAVVVLCVVLLAVFISVWIRTLRHPALRSQEPRRPDLDAGAGHHGHGHGHGPRSLVLPQDSAAGLPGPRLAV